MGLGSLDELPDISGHLPELEDMEDEGLAGAEDALGELASQDPIGDEEPAPEAPAADAEPDDDTRG